MRVSSSDVQVDVADDTWVAASPEVVAAAVADPARWLVWWQELRLEVTRDRGPKGQQWLARPAPARPTGRWRRDPVRWAGSLEVWVEPWRDGVLLHHYARLDPVPPAAPLTRRTADRARRARVLRWKHAVHALKDELEGTRPEQGAQGA